MACGDIWARDSSPGLSASRRQQIRLSRLGQRRAGWPEQLLQWGVGGGVLGPDHQRAARHHTVHATARSTPHESASPALVNGRCVSFPLFHGGVGVGAFRLWSCGVRRCSMSLPKQRQLLRVQTGLP